MVDTDEVGQMKLRDLVNSADEHEWNDWELDFIRQITHKKYSTLSRSQKAVITRLWEDLSG